MPVVVTVFVLVSVWLIWTNDRPVPWTPLRVGERVGERVAIAPLAFFGSLGL